VPGSPLYLKGLTTNGLEEADIGIAQPFWKEADGMTAQRKSSRLQLPAIVAGEWRGEIVGSANVNFGQVVQPGPPRQSVEFTYVILAASLIMPNKAFRWPGTVMIMAPIPMKTEHPDAGVLFETAELPSLNLSLYVSREQFSDMLPRLEAHRLKDFHFTVEEKDAEGRWAVRSWGMGTTRLAA